jgi:hypothetical protein
MPEAFFPAHQSSKSISSSSSNDTSSRLENIDSVRPLNQKPSFKFTPSSSLASKLPEFLASIKAANDSLEADITAGKQDNHLLEIGESSPKNQEERPYIEMNLGLGVLEKIADKGGASSDDAASEVKGATDPVFDAALKKPSNGKKSIVIEEL